MGSVDERVPNMALTSSASFLSPKTVFQRPSVKSRLNSFVFVVLVCAVSCSPAPYGENAVPSDASLDLDQGLDVGVDVARDAGRADVVAPTDTLDAESDPELDLNDGAEDDAHDLVSDPDIQDTCEPNACGGCGTLQGSPGGACGTCGSGEWVCDSPERVVCSGDGGDDALNGCGGCAPLDGVPEDPCGPCQQGRWNCDAPDRISCRGDSFNACGGCSPLEKEPGVSCGPCANGIVRCQGEEAVSCVIEELCPDGAQCDFDEVCGSGACSNGRCAPQGYVYAPPGEFFQGPREHEQQVHDVQRRRVTLTRGFFIQATEVTQSQWLEFAEYNPSVNGDCDQCPVESVSFHEVILWLNTRSEADGLEPCYRLSGCRGTPGDDYECVADRWWELDCSGWRLPTEAEWEYSARSGTVEATYVGDVVPSSCPDYSDERLNAIAWNCANSGGSTHAVGLLTPSPWGLFDSHGNVAELTYDWRHPIGPAPVVDPLVTDEAAARALRGGSFRTGAKVSGRQSAGVDTRSRSIGFRSVRTVDEE